MQLMDQDLSQLIARGTKDGFLTYDEVNAYLPDEDVNPEKLNSLLLALENRGIQLIEASEKKARDAAARRPSPNVRGLRSVDMTADEESPEQILANEAASQSFSSADMPKASEDPIRMYLSQMAEIPLLSREEEIALAKKIEITRKQYRRSLLETDYALRATVDTLQKVHSGELPFDRTIKVSLTERLTKEQFPSECRTTCER